MGIQHTALLNDDLDINIEDSDFRVLDSRLDNDLTLIEVGAVCGEWDHMQIDDYLDMDFTTYPADHSDLEIHDVISSETKDRRIKQMTTADIHMILSSLFTDAPDLMLDMNTITIDIQNGVISFDSESDLHSDYRNVIELNVQSGACLTCGADAAQNSIELLKSVSEEIGSIDEQIRMLEAERTRLRYAQSDTSKSLMSELDLR